MRRNSAGPQIVKRKGTKLFMHVNITVKDLNKYYFETFFSIKRYIVKIGLEHGCISSLHLRPL